MIRSLGAAFEQLDIAVQMARAAEQDVLQVIFFQVHVAAGADQNAVLVEQAHRGFVEAAVGGLAVLDVLLALDEGRRVGDDYVEAFLGVLQFLHRLEGITLDAAHLLRHAVECGVSLRSDEHTSELQSLTRISYDAFCLKKKKKKKHMRKEMSEEKITTKKQKKKY